VIDRPCGVVAVVPRLTLSRVGWIEAMRSAIFTKLNSTPPGERS
jgi:hypothetical protein